MAISVATAAILQSIGLHKDASASMTINNRNCDNAAAGNSNNRRWASTGLLWRTSFLRCTYVKVLSHSDMPILVRRTKLARKSAFVDEPQTPLV